MLKFFRRIRYDLMEKSPTSAKFLRKMLRPSEKASAKAGMPASRTGRYLKYAIGEIVLVVLGIIIALSINNWNEGKKLRRTEVKLLQELKSDLIATNLDLATDITKAKTSLIYTDSLYQKIVNQRKENKAQELIIPLFYNYERSALYAKKSAYESILSFGINNISNDSLRQDITDFYQLHLTRIKDIENLIVVLNRQEFNPLLRKVSVPFHDSQNKSTLSDMFSSNSLAKQNAFLVEDPNDEILHFLKEKYQLYRVINRSYAETQIRIERIIALIEGELKK